MSTKPYSPDPRAHPGLHVIALLEAVKGTLGLLAATGLELLGPLPLQHAVITLIRRFNLDPDHGALPSLLKTISPDAVHLAAAAMLAYGLLHVVEAWGLWRAKAWASVLGCLSAAIYLPFDIYAIARHPGWTAWAVLAINLLVVGVLARDLVRRRRR
ncbi:membrane protein [Xanthomonas oryzae pv. oryzae]|uniref:Putative membrane protein n=1 Tax=Xanthomonas oryzae pv. oryzicola (strain BLS256) TaxID=383407 RepID=G7TF99_XANOB|nr:putative membrane protein [Xanthomonas oryzae pv. oryzicola BLS256]AKN92470.1 membrane protein [Xanthomonas oryzae pv. oryzicola]OLG45606.1 membrane protein [Xanthomonas oryzae pv. oryzae]AKN96206.1 membrane protein [Xanthomonas oryzae pv. oryzicola]AKO05573.1 membrane protein [Xanthomonas oryzae pv. oryzicola]